MIKNSTFIFFFMIFMHIVDDYYLQGVLAKMKCKDWWKENYPDPKYKHDYIIALIMHSLSWSFMILLPLMFYINFQIDALFILTFIWNTIMHAVVDNMKANRYTINLIEDQIIHIIQIILSAICFLL